MYEHKIVLDFVSATLYRCLCVTLNQLTSPKLYEFMRCIAKDTIFLHTKRARKRKKKYVIHLKFFFFFTFFKCVLSSGNLLKVTKFMTPTLFTHKKMYISLFIMKFVIYAQYTQRTMLLSCSHNEANAMYKMTMYKILSVCAATAESNPNVNERKFFLFNLNVV